MMVIAIDGPAGSGKSTVARLLSERLNFFYIDTGAMYRALTYQAIKEKVNLEDEKELHKLARRTKIELNGSVALYGRNVKDKEKHQRVFVNGKDVTKKIRIEELTKKVFYIARSPDVRKIMVKKQREMAKKKDVVVEGRDIGTVVFPNADLKIYLDASLKERARRRYKELKEKGERPILSKIEKEIRVRDNYDKNRKVAPLKKAKGALYLDTTSLSIDEAVNSITNG